MAITRTYAVGQGGQVVRLDNHTGPWVDITPNFPNESETIWYDVMSDPLDPDKVTIVGDDNLGHIGSGILVSTDAGANWNIPGGNWIGSPGDIGLFLKEVWYVDSNIIWAVGWRGDVVQSLDAGLTFNKTTRIDITLDAYTQCIHAIDQWTAVVGGSYLPDPNPTAQDTFVWKTTDGGLNWTRLNGGLSLIPLSTDDPVGAAEGIWISADQQKIVVGTGGTQNISINGGTSFNSIVPEMPISGRHLTWYPSHDPNPANMWHVGGNTDIHINKSLDNGSTWATTRNGEVIIIEGAHFYTADDGYYIIGGDVFATSDSGVTGVLSYSDAFGLTFNAVWTGDDITVNPGCPCYLATNCADPLDVILITINCAVDPPLTVGTTYQFTELGGDPLDKCWTIELEDCAVGVPLLITATDTWEDCDACLNPLVPNICYDLEVACDGPCPDIFAISSFNFGPYVGQIISIQPPLTTDPECWYIPHALRQTVFISPDELAGYDLKSPFGGFQQGSDDITFSIPSFIFNGVEQISGSPPTDLMTPSNIQFVKCLQMACTNVPLNNPGGTTGYANLVDFINLTFANAGIVSMQSFNNSFDNCPILIIKPLETFRIQYRDGDVWSLDVILSNTAQGVQTYRFEVQAGNVTVMTHINTGTDFITCNDNIWCLTDPATSPVINGVTIEGPCPMPPLGESCEVIPRLGEPGFSTKNCDPKKVIDIKTKYADAVFAMFKRARYGIDTCCEFDLDKIDIKNQLIDLGELLDPGLCESGTPLADNCCLQPCNVVATLIVPNFITCPEPVGPVSAILIAGPIPAGICDAPVFTNDVQFGQGVVSIN